jgi:stringent starvation protein A
MTSSVRRASITLYSDPTDIHSHRCRLVLAEKGVAVNITDASVRRPTEDIVALNPYHAVPTLVDRESIIHHSRIIMEYLDERYPHPPLLPPYPAARAEARLILHRIDNDWYSLVEEIERSPKRASVARQTLLDHLSDIIPLFKQRSYFLGEVYSLVDCALGPLLWRLPHLGITLQDSTKPLKSYAARLFDRAAFVASLSKAEQKMPSL